MSLETLIIHYGYGLLFFGVMLEGETFLIIGAFLAHRGYLNLPLVMLTAFAGTFVIDQCSFWLGRIKGNAFLQKHPRWRARVANVDAKLQRWHTALVVGFRFLYGMRYLTPFVIGLSGYPVRRFVLLNLLGGIIWAVVNGLLGYAFGHAMELVLEDVRKYEIWIILGFILAGSAVGLYHLAKRLLKQNIA
ncbi:MAG TPA: DedA family protein [Blastocatellia bacterium]|nr:DedA family protein [Blastocatellia bacterium]HMX26737.1 DedA family protein [Blastocatellia bacterium]HMY72038.1 DedA family protein [Blastocatellia bacterium]HMZ20800.1 DedA family protein [Blastocatellia bacterium]HNG30037.1 DedA family protein [Blastocatellia bacterium]